MRKGLFGEAPPFTQLIFTAFTMLVCVSLFMFIGIILAPPIFGISLADVIGIIGSGKIGEHLGLLRYLQTFNNFSQFIIPALFLSYLFSGNPSSYFGFGNVTTGKCFGLVFLIMITAIPVVNLLTTFNEMIVFPDSLSWLEVKLKAMEDSAAELTEVLMTMDNVGWLFFNIFMIAVLPAIGEELIFRGILQKIFVRWTGNTHVGIIIASFFFSLMHMQFYGFFPRWLLGILFGYMLVWSGSIWLPIFAHFVNNCLAVVVTYLTQKGIVPEDLGEYGSTWGSVPVTILFTGVCICLLWSLHKINNKQSYPA